MNKNKLIPSLLATAVATGLGFSTVSYAVVALPVLSNGISVVTPTADTTPDYTFSTTVGGTIIYGGDCMSKTTTAVAGKNMVTFSRLKSGNHFNCTIKVKNSAGLTSAALVVPGFRVTYSAGTKLTATISKDLEGNGTIDSTEVTTYDMNGKIIKKTFAKGVDGVAKNFILNTYDVNGNVTASSTDFNNDGKFDEAVKMTNAYDDRNNLTVRKVSVKNLQGVFVVADTHTFTFDDKRQITKEVVTFPGKASDTITYAYNVNGKLASKKHSVNVPDLGSVVETTAFTYFTSGNLSKISLKVGSLPTFVIATATYNSTNQLTEIKSNTPAIPETQTTPAIPATYITFTYIYANGVLSSYQVQSMSGQNEYSELGYITLVGDKSLTNEGAITESEILM